MKKSDWKNQIRTLPNLLSLGRLLLIPVYTGIYRRADTAADYILAGAILAVSCATDLLDGFFARRFNQITTLGKILDPLADKLTQFSLMLCLAPRTGAMGSLMLIFVLKELFQLFAGVISLCCGKMLQGALAAGKLSTAVLFCSLIAMVLLPGLSKAAVDSLVLVSAMFLFLSLISYVFTYFGWGNRLSDLKAEE